MDLTRQAVMQKDKDGNEHYTRSFPFLRGATIEDTVPYTSQEQLENRLKMFQESDAFGTQADDRLSRIQDTAESRADKRRYGYYRMLRMFGLGDMVKDDLERREWNND